MSDGKIGITDEQIDPLRCVRIVVDESQADASGATKTQETKVLTHDGHEIGAITRLVLTCDTDDVWRAEIHCIAIPPHAIRAFADQLTVEYERWYRRWWRWLAGQPRDITNLSSRSRYFIK